MSGDGGGNVEGQTLEEFLTPEPKQVNPVEEWLSRSIMTLNGQASRTAVRRLDQANVRTVSFEDTSAGKMAQVKVYEAMLDEYRKRKPQAMAGAAEMFFKEQEGAGATMARLAPDLRKQSGMFQRDREFFATKAEIDKLTKLLSTPGYTIPQQDATRRQIGQQEEKMYATPRGEIQRDYDYAKRTAEQILRLRQQVATDQREPKPKVKSKFRQFLDTAMGTATE